MKLFEFLWVRNDKICHFWEKTAHWYRYLLDRGKVVSVPIKVVPVSIYQKRVGTSTNQSGTGIDASSSPDFCTLALLSPKFVHR